MGVEGGKDCSFDLSKIDCIWEITPNSVFKCCHRTYTEAEKIFLDFIDSELEERKHSTFHLKSIDYGDARNKFDFPIIQSNPLRANMWKEVQRLDIPDSPPAPENAHRGTFLKEARKLRKIPQVAIDSPYGLAFSATTTQEDMDNANMRKRNYVKSPKDFQEWYMAILKWTEKLQNNTKAHTKLTDGMSSTRSF